MTALLSFATSRLGLGIIVGLVVALMIGGIVISKNATIRELRGANEALSTQLAAARRDLNQCRANTATLEASISRQNAAVEALRVQGEARVAELDRVAVRARQEAETANARARRIMGAQPSGDACIAARELILENVR